MKTYIVAYEATDGWRWTEKGKNHEIVSHGEAYSSKAGLEDFLGSKFPGVEIKWLTPGDGIAGSET